MGVRRDLPAGSFLLYDNTVRATFRRKSAAEGVGRFVRGPDETAGRCPLSGCQVFREVPGCGPGQELYGNKEDVPCL